MAESESNGSSVEPKADLKKLIHSRGGHRGAFTKLDNKIDLLLLR